MTAADQLIQGYAAYTSAEEFGAEAQGEAPATTPLTITTVSSPECIQLSASATAATITGHC